MSEEGRAPSEHLLRTLASVAPASRVLDLGCGMGRHTVPLAALGFDLYACDADRTNVAATRAAVQGVLGEETARRITQARPAALGYPDRYFDWVVAHGAYDAATDDEVLADMLAETRRVLQPGGWVYVAVAPRVLGADAAPGALTARFESVGFGLAEAPVAEGGVLRGIYRRVGAEIVG